MSILKAFPSVPQETFFSWLHRQSIFNEQLHYPLYMLLDDFSRYRNMAAFDRDFDFYSPFAKNACFHLGLGAEECRDAFVALSSWLIPEHYRRAFCWGCLQEQISTRCYPCALTSWCTVCGTHCLRHMTLLQECTAGKHISLNSGLAAFIHYSDNISNFQNDKIHAMLSSESIVYYWLRVYMDIRQAERQSRSLVFQSGAARWQIYKLIIQIILLPTYGVINTVIKRKRVAPRAANIWQSLSHGPLCSSVVDRAFAMLLAGLALGFFSDCEVEEIISLLGVVSYVDIRFFDAKTLGASCNSLGLENSNLIGGFLDELSRNMGNSSLTDFAIGFSNRTEN